MKKFISKRTIRLPRYKILCIIFVSIVIFFIILNFFINFYLKRVDEENFYNIFFGNVYGNVLDKYNMFNNRINNFYKNMYGFSLDISESAMNEKENVQEIIVNSESSPLIYIYNTFQTSKYKKNYYNSYNINSVITQANLILQEYLYDYNISSIVETHSVVKILKENNIDYSLSYRGSRLLMEDALDNNKTLKYFFDIQMSDNNYETTTAIIDNKAYAKILFVVGTDNNNYLLNQKFANRLNRILESINKDLTRGVSMRGGSGYHGVYNQDFCGTALLIQVGGEENTIDEVNRTLKILASVINDIILEDTYEK